MFKIDFLWSKVLKPKKGRYFNLWPQVKKVFQVINTNYEIYFCDLTWMNLINKHRTQDSLNVETANNSLLDYQILKICQPAKSVECCSLNYLGYICSFLKTILMCGFLEVAHVVHWQLLLNHIQWIAHFTDLLILWIC